MSWMKVASFVSLFAVAWCVGTSAQDEGEEEDPRVLFVKQKVEYAFVEASMGILNLRIDDMTRQLLLSESTVRKLRLAAKGASEEFARTLAKDIDSMINNFPYDVDQFLVNGTRVAFPDVPREKFVELAAIPEEEVNPQITVLFRARSHQVQVKRENGSSSSRRSKGVVDLLKVGRWNRIVNKLIAKEELEAYEETVTIRRREALASMASGYLSIILRLDQDQVDEIYEWLREVDDLLDVDETYSFRFQDNLVDKINRAKLNLLLTEDQRERLRLHSAGNL